MSNKVAYALLADMVAALGLRHEAQRRVAFTEEERLPSCWPVSDLAAASIAAAAIAVSQLVYLRAGSPSLSVSYRSASLWFGWSIKPVGWQLPDP